MVLLNSSFASAGGRPLSVLDGSSSSSFAKQQEASKPSKDRNISLEAKLETLECPNVTTLPQRPHGT